MSEKSNEIKEVSPALGLKILQVWTEEMSDGDYTDIDYEARGITNVLNVICQAHDTNYQVINTPESVTTSKEDDKLRVTASDAHDGDNRSIIVIGE